MSEQKDERAEWWENVLKANEENGKSDADKGVFDWPYLNNDDPGDQDECAAYKRGFDARRRELGDAFKWLHEK